LQSLLRQRIYGLALGYEDLNDQDSLRKDLLWQSAVERSKEMASSATLCRLENRAGRKEAWLMHEVLFEKFVNSFQSAPRELILDFDCTDDRVHGLQEGRHFRRSGLKVRLFSRFKYKAKTWDKKRRVIAKAEYSDRGANPRYVLTNLEGCSQSLYDDIYCARGEMENRIKEQQLGLFSDRTSCHAWWANQFRLLLSSAVYVLLEALRRIGLKGTELARAQVGTIRLRLLKIGTIITRNTRRIRLWFSSSFPLQELFYSCLRHFAD